MAYMKRLTGAILVACSLLAEVAPSHVVRDVNSFIATERPRALQGILDNIGPDGALAQGAKPGVVIASPSTVNPNYLYTWTRDSALTLRVLIDELINGNTGLKSYIDDYVTSQAIIQTVANPSGTLTTGKGLGEPKYNIDETRFNGNWGRPQRDGPALRAIALIEYINWLIDNKQSDTAKNVVWPVVINDLNYVGQYWNQSGFDLWEEVYGSSFFTIQSQHRALVQGSTAAKRLGLTCTGCDSQAPEILCFLQTFWNGKYIVSNINVNNGRTGLDANSILGPISDFDIDAYCDSPTFQPCNSRSLANFKAVIDSFRDFYGVNKGIAAGQAVAVGRYTEDVYYNGNPWYLCTLAAAEFLYDAVAQWRARRNLVVDDVSLPFFKEIYPDVAVRQYNPGNANSPFEKIMGAVMAYADGFVDVVEKYISPNGSLSEQFDRNTGTPLSAYDLTWSFAAFVTMAQRRSGQYPKSWGVRQAAAPPATCRGTSVPGVYTPATSAGAPPLNVSCTVEVLFRVNASTFFGEDLYLIGNDDALGKWDFNNANAMAASNYTSERPLWYVYLDLPPSTTVSYKYVRHEPDNSLLYESQNRTLTVPACAAVSATQEDAWVGPTGTPPMTS